MSGAPPAHGRPRRVGLFGGSFDPVHEGHLHAARSAQRAFGLDRVVFVPAYRSPFKLDGHGAGRRPPAAPEHRRAMVELATADEPSWSVSGLELERGGASYTIDTVRGLRAATGEPADAELFLILGSDNLHGLAGWREIEELLARVRPVVVHREGDPAALLAGLRASLGEEQARRFADGFLHLPPVEVSSTELRRELVSDPGRTPSDLADLRERVPPRVLDYICEHGLYGGGS